MVAKRRRILSTVGTFAVFICTTSGCLFNNLPCEDTDVSCSAGVTLAVLSQFLPSAEPAPDPLPVSGATLWLAAGFGRTHSGGQVAAWADQSGNANDAVASGFGPTLKENARNGQPALTFDGVFNDFTLGSNYIFSTAAQGGMTIFVLLRSDQTDGGGLHFVIDSGFFANEGYGLRYSADSGGSAEAGFYTSSDHGGVSNTFDITATTADWVILAARVEFGLEQRVFINGTSVYQDSISLSQLTTAEIREQPFRNDVAGGPFSIGLQAKFAQTGRSFAGDIAEIIVFPSALSLADRQAIECYLSGKYAVSVSQSCS